MSCTSPSSLSSVDPDLAPSAPWREGDKPASSPSAFIGSIRWVERGIAPVRGDARRSLGDRLAHPTSGAAVPLALLVGVVAGAFSLAVVHHLDASPSAAAVLAAGLFGALVSVIVVGLAAGRRGDRRCTIYLGRDGVERVTETDEGTLREGVAFEDVAHAIREHEPRLLPSGKLAFKERLLLIDAEGRVLFSLTMLHAASAPRRCTALIGRVQREYLERRIAREVLRGKLARLGGGDQAIPWYRIDHAEAALQALAVDAPLPHARG